MKRLGTSKEKRSRSNSTSRSRSPPRGLSPKALKDWHETRQHWRRIRELDRQHQEQKARKIAEYNEERRLSAERKASAKCKHHQNRRRRSESQCRGQSRSRSRTRYVDTHVTSTEHSTSSANVRPLIQLIIEPNMEQSTSGNSGGSEVRMRLPVEELVRAVEFLNGLQRTTTEAGKSSARSSDQHRRSNDASENVRHDRDPQSSKTRAVQPSVPSSLRHHRHRTSRSPSPVQTRPYDQRIREHDQGRTSGSHHRDERDRGDRHPERHPDQPDRSSRQALSKPSSSTRQPRRRTRERSITPEPPRRSSREHRERRRHQSPTQSNRTPTSEPQPAPSEHPQRAIVPYPRRSTEVTEMLESYWYPHYDERMGFIPPPIVYQYPMQRPPWPRMYGPPFNRPDFPPLRGPPGPGYRGNWGRGTWFPNRYPRYE